MVKKIQALYVLMNGVLVGMLEKTAQGGLQFTYHQDWLNQAGARPISLSLPLKLFSRTSGNNSQ